MKMRFTAFLKFRNFLLVTIFMLSSIAAFATHFRYGNITWQRVAGNPYQIKFKVTQAWRRSAFGSASSTIAVGSVITTSNFQTGIVGDSTKINLKVTEVNLAEDWFYGEWMYVKTYPSVTANYQASFYNCCRILPLLNNANGTVRVNTTVQVNSSNDAPVSNIPPFINLPVDTDYVSYQIPAIDPNGDALTYSFTSQGQFGTPSIHPDSLNISSTGLLTWSTKNKTTGSIYNTSVKITDSKGASVTVDFLIRIVGKSIPSSFDYTTTPPNGTTFQMQPGDSIAFQVNASDVDSGDTAKLIVAGLPPGATFNTSGTNPVEGNFGWNPDPSQEGVYLVNITAQDDAGVQNSTTVYFNVSYKPRFDIPTTPGNNSVFVITPSDSLEHPVKTYHPDSLNRVVLSIASGQKASMGFSPSLPTLALNPAQTNFKWKPSVNDWGINRVVYRAIDTFRNEVAYDTIFYAVDNVPVITSTPRLTATIGAAYTYTLSATDIDIPYGDSIFVEEKTLPSFLSITNNNNGTWTIAGTPDLSNVGTHSIMFEVADKVNHFGGTHVSNDVQTYTLTVLPPVSVTGNVTNTTIYGGNNGSIDVTAAGGAGVYTYSWADNVTSEDRSNLSAGTYTVIVTDSNGGTVTSTYTINQPAQLIATANVSNATINGVNNGAINITVSGGVGPYTYGWSNNTTTEDQSGLGAGTYTIIVTDANGAIFTTTYTITQPAALLATSNITGALGATNSGNIDITITGGVGPYTYSWSNGATTEDINNLVAGTYTVTITDANGAVKTYNYTVNQIALLGGAIAVSPVHTVSGQAPYTIYKGYGSQSVSLAATATGGTGGYTYSWSPASGLSNSHSATITVSPNVTTTYTLTIKDASNVTAVVTKTIYVVDVRCSNNKIQVCHKPYWGNSQQLCLPASAIAAHLAHGDYLGECLEAYGNVSHVTCYGGNNGSINLSVAGGVPPYTYNWNNNATTQDLNSLSAGTYTVIVTDGNGNTVNESFCVTQPSQLKLNAVVKNACGGSNNGSINLSINGGCSSYSYKWNNNATSQDRTNLAAGIYSVIVTDAKGCIATDTYTVAQPSAINITAAVTNVTCYDGNNGAINITVTGGNSPYTYSWGSGNSCNNNNVATQDRNNLSAGSYTIQVTDANGCTKMATFTVVEPNAISGNISVSPNATVNNGKPYTIYKGYGSQSVMLNAQVIGGTPGYTYLWSGGGLNNQTSASVTVAPTTTTTYTLKITDSKGCTKAITKKIYVEDVRCGNGNNSNKVRVCHRGDEICIDASAVPAHLSHGCYIGECNDDEDERGGRCSKPGESATENDESISSLVKTDVKVYPNPTVGVFTVELPAETKTAYIVITDMTGKVVSNQVIENEQYARFNLDGMAKGVYMIQVMIDKKQYRSSITVQ